MNGKQFVEDYKSIKQYEKYQHHMKEMYNPSHKDELSKKTAKLDKWNEKKAKLKPRWTEADQKLEDDLWAS